MSNLPFDLIKAILEHRYWGMFLISIGTVSTYLGWFKTSLSKVIVDPLNEKCPLFIPICEIISMVLIVFFGLLIIYSVAKWIKDKNRKAFKKNIEEKETLLNEKVSGTDELLKKCKNECEELKKQLSKKRDIVGIILKLKNIKNIAISGRPDRIEKYRNALSELQIHWDDLPPELQKPLKNIETNINDSKSISFVKNYVEGKIS